jgi:hypothetical protein
MLAWWHAVITLVIALGTLWRQEHACGSQHGVATATDVVSIEAHAVWARDRAKGASRKLFDLPDAIGSRVSLAVVTPEVVVVRDPTELTGFELATGKKRWSHVVVEGSTLAATDAIAVATGDTKGIALELFDPSSGTSRWKVTLDARTGPVEWVGIGATQVYVLVRDNGVPRHSSLIARAKKDGAKGWSAGLEGWTHPEIAGDDVVVAPESIDIVDGAKGTVSQLAVDADRLVAHGNRAYAIEMGAHPKLVAIDVPAHETVWTRELTDEYADFAGATDANVFVVEGHDALRVFDATTGKIAASYGVDGSPDVGVYAGAPLVLACDGTGLVGLDLSAKAVDETATVTGTIRCDNCASHKPFEVRIAGRHAATDRAGHFSLEVTGRGSFGVWSKLSPGYSAQAIGHVVLAGKRTYDLGTLKVEAPDGE